VVIKLFFIAKNKRSDIEDPHTKELRLFGKIIDIGDKLGFPKFSNDCQYLKISHSDDIVKNLGGPIDDYRNYFTTRMLLILESKCIYGEETYSQIVKEFLKTYFSDYPDHSDTFQPVFLLNDIHRYWKTLLLNYENKRGEVSDDGSDSNKIKHKVRNFKLKYSRMTTCFATIGAIGSYETPVTEEQALQILKITPRERLIMIGERIPATNEHVSEVLDEYSWFLEKTGLTTEELRSYFSEKSKRTEMFDKANRYGDLMYKLIEQIDQNIKKGKLLRYLVI
jgi:hypothetical protein